MTRTTFSTRAIRRGVPLTAVLASGALLAACGSGDAAPAASDDAAAESETVELALHFNSPQASWVGIYIADQQGYYEDHGIDLEIAYLGGSTLAVQALGSNQADIAIAAPDALIAGIEQDLPLIAVANHIQQDATGVISAQPVEDFTDLAGMRIATAQGTAEAGLFESALNTAGIADDVQVDYVDAAAKCTMVVGGQADSCTGFSFAQLVQLQLADEVDPSFLPFSTEEQPLPGAVIITSESFTESSPEVLERFLEATFEGYREADADRELAIETMTELSETTDPEQVEIATDMVLGLTRSDRTEADGWAWMTDEVWDNLIAELVAGGVLDEPVTAGSLYTNDYLPKSGKDWQ